MKAYCLPRNDVADSLGAGRQNEFSATEAPSWRECPKFMENARVVSDGALHQGPGHDEKSIAARIGAYGDWDALGLAANSVADL